jgi:hypothetical protein
VDERRNGNRDRPAVPQSAAGSRHAITCPRLECNITHGSDGSLDEVYSSLPSAVSTKEPSHARADSGGADIALAPDGVN